MTINERVSDLIKKFTHDDMTALRRFVECCEDPDAGGHDVEKSTITRLSQYGALRQVRPGYHEVTEFGEFILNGGIDELQQYRAAAEKPIGSFHIIDQQVDGTTDYVKDGEWPIDNGELLVYAAPQVTSVPDDAFERALSVLNDTLDDCGDSERGLLLALDRMGIEVAGAAPAEQAEQLSGNTEQVSQPVLPATQFKPVADLYGIAVPGGRSTSYSTDAAEASDCRVMGWDVQEFVKLERLQEAITGNSPAIPDGWLAEAERLAEMYGTSFVVFRHGEEAQCADPTKVIISFTDEGLGHHSAAPKQEAREVKK
ncbi:hypothetical protein [Atlantibacter hermannii]|uniref:hypothetical protein n=1 Tax=Atlantibacter hermannii TaxID=565 RepID=UPI002FDE328A